MREIKFRWKRIDDWQWVYWYLSFIYVNPKDKASIYDPIAVASFDVYTETVWQYIWLDDKNWKRIYEWDIVRNCGEKNFWIYPCEIKHIIDDNNSKWMFNTQFLPVNKDWFMRRVIPKNIEVIWNIYENKDLLDNED